MRAAVLCCVAGAGRDGGVPRRVPPGGGVRDGGGVRGEQDPGCAVPPSRVSGVSIRGCRAPGCRARMPSRRAPLTPALQARGVGRSGRPSGCSPKVRPSFGGHVPLSGMRSSGPGRRADSQPGDSEAQLRGAAGGRCGCVETARSCARRRLDGGVSGGPAVSRRGVWSGRRRDGALTGQGVRLRRDAASAAVTRRAREGALLRESSRHRSAGVPTLRRRSGRGSRGGARRGGRGSGRGPRA